MIDSTIEHDFDEFRDDFVVYLATRLGLSPDEALLYLGDWLSTFKAEARTPPNVELELDDDAPR
jgi:hypothetical protein